MPPRLADLGFASTAEQATEGVDLTGTTWVITGVNSGLGKETTRVMSLRGARIVGLARSLEKASNALADLEIDGTPVACDLADLTTVHAAVDTILALNTPLHGVLANAGVMAIQNLEQVHGYERQFFTNHVGHHALIAGLLHRLSDRARVVMTSSGAHTMAAPEGIEFDNLSGERDYHPWRMYGQSKLANILFARSLAKQFEGSKKTANALHPGVIQTNLGRHVPNAEAMYAKMKKIEKTIAQGAATQCTVATHPELAKVSGQYFSDCRPKGPSKIARDDALAAQLWARTESIIDELKR